MFIVFQSFQTSTKNIFVVMVLTLKILSAKINSISEKRIKFFFREEQLYFKENQWYIIIFI